MLLLPVALAEPEEFRLRDGITWSSTPEEVEEVVGKNPQLEETSDCLIQVYSNISFGNCSGDFRAYFVGHYNQLISMGYELEEFPANQTLEQAVDDLKAGLNTKYTPAEFELSALVDLLNGYVRLLGGDRIFSEENLPAERFHWVASDGTEIYLLGSYENNSWELAYFNVSGIEDLLALMDAPNTNGL